MAALKSAPSEAFSKVSRLRLTRSPAVLDPLTEKELSGTIADIEEAVGTNVQIASTAHPAIAAAVSFSIVRDGFANVSVIEV